MSSNNLSASWQGNELVVSGFSDEDKAKDDMQWRVSRVTPSRVLAFKEATDFQPEKSLGFAKCSPDIVYDVFTGVNHRCWTGMICVDTGFGNKKIFFNRGELVFASSDLMDDRLGEVIYRDSLISLDQLTKFAVQVDRKTKFGQVLLKSGTFSTSDLWYSLKAQVREIFHSVFLSESCFIEMHTDRAPMEVSFEDGTDAILESAYSFGAQFRAFSKRLNANVRVHLGDPSGISRTGPGTFIGDFIELCQGEPSIDEVLERSQLANINTLVCLHKLVATGVLRLDGLSEFVVSQSDARFAGLRSVMDGYQMLHGIAVQAFKHVGIPMPAQELAAFALSLNNDGTVSLYLDSSGNLPGDSISGMLQQCASNTHRLPYFQNRIESLIRYFLQMSGDILPYDSARNLKREFKEIMP